MRHKPLLIEIKQLIADICGDQLLKAKSWEDKRFYFEDLSIVDKRRLLEAKLAQTKKEKWHALVDKRSLTQRIAEIMFESLNNGRLKNTDLLSSANEVIRIAEDELLESIADEVQFFIDAELKRQFNKIQKMKASV